MSGECDDCGEHCLDCDCLTGRKRRALCGALNRLSEHVRNCDSDFLQKVLSGFPLFAQEAIDDWTFQEQKYPSPWHIPVIKLELRAHCRG